MGGLGIGAPVTIDVAKGVVVNATNLRLEQAPLGKLTGRRVGDFCHSGQRCQRVGTWGEHLLGAARGFHDVLGVFVGTGIGGGVILGGKLFHGHFSTAGEIGHTVIHVPTPLPKQLALWKTWPGRYRGGESFSPKSSSKPNHPSKVTQLCGGDYRLNPGEGPGPGDCGRRRF